MTARDDITGSEIYFVQGGKGASSSRDRSSPISSSPMKSTGRAKVQSAQSLITRQRDLPAPL